MSAICTREREAVSHTFEVDSFDWNGFCFNIGMQVDAEVGPSYCDETGFSRGDVEIVGTHLATFESFDSVGNPVPKFFDRLILQHCEGELIEAVTAYLGGELDIKVGLLEVVGQ